MNAFDAERDENVIPGSTGIDRSIGYLGLGLLVIGFFMVVIFGMSRVQRITSAPTADSATGSADTTPPPSEIGGAPQ